MIQPLEAWDSAVSRTKERCATAVPPKSQFAICLMPVKGLTSRFGARKENVSSTFAWQFVQDTMVLTNRARVAPRREPDDDTIDARLLQPLADADMCAAAASRVRRQTAGCA